MPSAVIVETQPRHSVARPALIAVGAVAAAALLWLVLGLTRSPSTISRLTIVNPSSVDVEIEVSPARDAATLGLGHMIPRSSHTYRDVLDQGSTWVFAVSSARSRLAELQVDRKALDASEWTVRLPSDLGEQEVATRSSP